MTTQTSAVGRRNARDQTKSASAHSTRAPRECRCCRSGCPSAVPRRVSIIGVNGWYWANQRNQAGIESVGTNALPMNGNGWSGSTRLRRGKDHCR